jgi:hypothetical protein
MACPGKSPQMEKELNISLLLEYLISQAINSRLKIEI